MGYHCYFNGNIYPVDTPLLATNDLSLLRGYGLFDYFRTYNGIPFRWNDYWARFEHSAQSMRLKVPIDQLQAENTIKELLRISGEPEVAFRMILTGGYTPDSISIGQPNFIIRTEPIPKVLPSDQQKGIRVLTYDFVRDIPEVKVTNYLHLILMADQLKQQQAHDLLYHSNENITELTRSNVFIVKGDTLITPDQQVLLGITRKVIMELATPHMEVIARPVSLLETLEADEVFTTSSNKRVLPISHIGNKKIGGGFTPKTHLLQKLFEEYIGNWGKG